MTKQKVLAAAAFMGVAVLLASCSSSGTEAASSSAVATANAAAPSMAASGAVAEIGSFALPDCTGQDVTTCSADGFDPARDGFSFPNFTDAGTLGAQSLISLFGVDAVCATVADGQCTFYPAAEQWAEQINQSMTNGHCEGLAVLAEYIFQGYLTAADLDPAATSTFDLTFDDPDVRGPIDLFWATQMLPKVQEAYNSFKTLAPTQIAAELADGLQTGKGYTLGIYQPLGAHAITPVSVHAEGDKIAISVYDNNYPGTVQRVMIDPATETWSYAGGATNPDAPTGGWEGGTGTMDLTPMVTRLELPSAAPFADAISKGAARGTAALKTIMVSTSDPTARVSGTFVIDGSSYDTSDPTVVLPAGLTARPTLGADLLGRGFTYVVDTKVVRGFRFMPKATGASGPAPVKLSIDSFKSPRLTLDTTQTEGGTAGFEVVESGEVIVTTDDGVESTLNIANGLNSLDLPVPDGVDVAVGSDSGDAQIFYFDDGGEIVGEYELDDQTPSGDVVNGVATFDEATGEFDVTEEVAEPEAYDEDAVTTFTDTVRAAATDMGSEFTAESDEGSESAEGSESDDTTDENADESGSDDSDGASGGGNDSDSSSSNDDGGGSDDSGSGSDDSGSDDSGGDDSGGGSDDGAGDSGGSDDGGTDSGGADEGGDSGGGSDEAADDSGSADDGGGE